MLELYADDMSGDADIAAVADVLADRARLEAIGIDCSSTGRRPLVRCCVDWSEQRHHLSGALGARLLRRAEEVEWVTRLPGSRAVCLTEAGERDLVAAFGLDEDGILVSRQPCVS